MAIVRIQEVVDNRSVLVGNGQGKADEIFCNISNSIDQTKAPNVKIQRKAQLLRCPAGKATAFIAFSLIASMISSMYLPTIKYN